jgi:hypothetical protein
MSQKNQSSALTSALHLQKKLLDADLNNSIVKEEFNEFIQTNFCPNSEIVARRKEIESFKEKLPLTCQKC